ncbi:S1C family serine protease [Luedemannella flava]|uniref:S1C family serine protease n=1 Tax=Luedemannella flava TaxID=349316 RepID=UPI0031CF03A8
MSSPPRLGRTAIDARITPPTDAAVDAGTRPARPSRTTLVAAGALAIGVLIAAVCYRWGAAGAPRAAPTPAPSAGASAAPTTADIYAAVAPSVVSIDANRGTGRAVEASGTGVVANADGTVITARHVVAGAKTITITFADGTRSPATILAEDPKTDIALLAPTTFPQVLVPAVLGGRLAVGDPVIAIGDQLGLTRTTTTGVVSGLDRATTAPDGGGRIGGLIQFDAAVNHGSSGGPLLSATGEVVGIVVALANPTDAGTFIGVGFAVPIGAALSAGGGGRAPQQ